MGRDNDLNLEEMGADPLSRAGDGEVSRPENRAAVPDRPRSGSDLEAVYDIPVQVSAVLGKSTMQVNQLLKLGRGAVVELEGEKGNNFWMGG